MPDQKTMRTRCLGGFSVMWVTKLLISPVKKGFFAQKPPNLARIWHFWPLLAHSVPCWWVGWWLWRVGCISQDTYLLYHTIDTKLFRSPMQVIKADSMSRGVIGTKWPDIWSSAAKNTDNKLEASMSLGRRHVNSVLLVVPIELKYKHDKELKFDFSCIHSWVHPSWQKGQLLYRKGTKCDTSSACWQWN